MNEFTFNEHEIKFLKSIFIKDEKVQAFVMLSKRNPDAKADETKALDKEAEKKDKPKLDEKPKKARKSAKAKK